MPILPSLARCGRAASAAVVAALLVPAASAAAQPAERARVDSARRPPGAAGGAAGRAGVDAWEVAPFVGYATRSPVHFWGLTPGRNHLMLGVQFVKPMGRDGPLTVAYAPNVVPLFVLTNNPRAAARATRTAGREVPACEAVRCGPVYGVAAAPLGMRVEARPHPAVRVFAATAGGLVLFSRNVPVPEARRLNATLEWGGGAVVRTGSGPAVQMGFKYHHLSNGYTAARNPGVDGRVLYGGLLWRVGGGRARR